MMYLWNKKIHVLTIILIIGFGIITFSFPNKTRANMPVIDAAAVKLLGKIAAIDSGMAVVQAAQAAKDHSIWTKEYILDGIVYTIGNQILQSLTGSVVNWINSGFEGNPAFIGDPGGFFLGVGDQIIGDFLEKAELTNFLCSPFSIDVRLSLAFRYQPFQRRISCTLSDVIRNTTNAIEGASINGFTAGDFRQGGFPAFLSLTTEPQNNVYGATVEANTELSLRIANMQVLKQNELNWGRGFLSWRDCSGSQSESLQKAKESRDKMEKGSEEEYYANLEIQNIRKNCPIQTPGSVIAGQLDKSLGSPVDKLNMADEFNEIINALFAQLVKQVLTAGLGSVSGSGPSDPSSYLNRIQQEQANNNVQLQTIKRQILDSVDGLIKNESDFKAAKDISIGYVMGLQQSLQNAKACFSNKMDENMLTVEDRRFALEQIGDADTAITNRVIPLISRLVQEAGQADRNKLALEEIRRVAISASTVNEISGAAEDYQRINSSGILNGVGNIANAISEQEIIREQIRPYESLAESLTRSCAVFPARSIRP